MRPSPITIHFPRKLIAGPGCLDQLSGELQRLGARNVFILTIEPLLPVIEPFVSALRETGMELALDTSIRQEPYFSDFQRLMGNLPFAPDTVVGIGGGSVLDLAKLVAAQVGNEQPLSDYVGIGLLKQRAANLVCVPATAGTGSEASPNAILVDDEDGQKKGIISPFLVPDLVLLDPDLTLTLPPAITAATGIDALTHCLEAYTNKFAHPLIDLYALKGIELIAAHLERAVNGGEDRDARMQVLLGSYYGGVCLGPVNTAAVHALSYPLGTLYHLPHGLSNALLLPSVMAFNLPSCVRRTAEVAKALGAEAGADDTETAWRGVVRVRDLMAACRLPLRLRDAGVGEDRFEEMAAAALKIQRLLKNNPREVSLADAVHIYQAAY
jgi:alcohol dehydrogenase